MLKNNKLSVAMLVVGGIFTSASAIAKPDFYGRFSLGVLNTYDQDEGERVTKIENQASRLGIKGNASLNETINFIYQLETGINPSDSSKPLFSMRNSFIGVEGNFGQFIAGTFDTPLKKAQGKVDLFNDTVFDLSKIASGEVRHQQSLQYQTPSLSGFKAAVNWLPSAKKGVDDGLSVSAGYAVKRFAITVAVDNRVAGDGGVITKKSEPLNTARAVFSVNASETVALGFLAQYSEGVGSDKSRESAWLTSAAWTIDKVKLKAQLGQGLADRDASGASSDARISQLSLGVDYSIVASTTAFFYMGVSRFEEGAGGTLAKESRNSASAGLGLRYKF